MNTVNEDCQMSANRSDRINQQRKRLSEELHKEYQRVYFESRNKDRTKSK